MAADFVLRGARMGAVLAGIIGGVVGLIVGLRVYAPTAWFAVLEIGVPAAIAGAPAGAALAGLASLARRRVRE